jgi:hypothetical protein
LSLQNNQSTQALILTQLQPFSFLEQLGALLLHGIDASRQSVTHALKRAGHQQWITPTVRRLQESRIAVRGAAAGLQVTSGEPCRFPLRARLKHCSPSDGIQLPFVSCQDFCEANAEHARSLGPVSLQVVIPE